MNGKIFFYRALHLLGSFKNHKTIIFIIINIHIMSNIIVNIHKKRRYCCILKETDGSKFAAFLAGKYAPITQKNIAKGIAASNNHKG